MPSSSSKEPKEASREASTTAQWAPCPIVLPIVRSVGPFILLAVLVWAWLRTRNASKKTDRRAERGARELREELAEQPKKDVDL